MSDVLDQAVAKAKTLSLSRQDEMGAVLLDMVEQDTSSFRLNVAQQAEVNRRLSGKIDFVPPEEMDAFIRKMTE
jgi:hypothetical protein